MTIVVVLAAVILLYLIGALWHRKYGGFMPEPYRGRPCQGVSWRRAFPTQSKKEIRHFLRVFAEAFAFRESQKLQVAPSDKVYEVYRAIYPKLGGPDALELESLASLLERKYGIVFAALWNTDLTFGHLYSVCSSVVAMPAATRDA